jgi:hypothetical protein
MGMQVVRTFAFLNWVLFYFLRGGGSSAKNGRRSFFSLLFSATVSLAGVDSTSFRNADDAAIYFRGKKSGARDPLIFQSGFFLTASLGGAAWSSSSSSSSLLVRRGLGR